MARSEKFPSQKAGKVMECQYGDCTNVGVHSCSVCGKLVCGKHAPIAGVYPKCITCWQVQKAKEDAAWQVQKAKEDAADKISNRGCLVFFAGLVAFVLPFIIAHSGNVYGFPVFIILLGLVTLIVGAIIFLVGIMRR